MTWVAGNFTHLPNRYKEVDKHKLQFTVSSSINHGTIVYSRRVIP